MQRDDDLFKKPKTVANVSAKRIVFSNKVVFYDTKTSFD
jgi:hypothetical protein